MNDEQLEQALRETLDVCDRQLASVEEQIEALTTSGQAAELPAVLRDQFERTIAAFLATRAELIETRNGAVEALNAINAVGVHRETKAKFQ